MCWGGGGGGVGNPEAFLLIKNLALVIESCQVTKAPSVLGNVLRMVNLLRMMRPNPCVSMGPPTSLNSRRPWGPNRHLSNPAK